MSNTRMVNLKNMVNKTVGVKLPEYGVNRKWTTKGQVIPLPYDTVEQMLWHEGFRKMIDRGILYIENMQDKIDLGLEPADATTPENIKVLSDIQIKNLLVSQPYDVFKKEIFTLNMTQVNNIVNYAIANEIVDVQKAELLRTISNIDILKAISNKKEIERLDKAEEEKERQRRMERQ